MKYIRKELNIILVFSILHSVVVVLSRWLELSDHLMLTTLTMLMALSLCQVRRTTVNTMVMLLIIVNFGGFYLGSSIGSLLKHFISNTYLRGGLVTFSTSVIIGAVVEGIVTLIERTGLCRNRKEISTYWLMLVFTVIIIARLVLIIINGKTLYSRDIMLNVIVDYTFCCVALLYLAVNSVKDAREAQQAKEKSNIAQYSYIRLQQQVKPHFMFNNLSILNSLICERKVDEASDFVYKLAYLYRYMISNEEENLVTIREELDFVSKYTDLMKVRFGPAFEVVIDIDESLRESFVVPCSIQLLIENSIKHNGGTEHTPLDIRIYNSATHLIVCNNILKKLSCEPTTHLGLKYIKKLYGDLSSADVIVESTEDEFVVKLPIIR